MFVARSSRYQEAHAKRELNLVSAFDFTSQNQGSGYPLKVFKVTLKLTGPVKILTMGHLGSSLV